jgi:hypothetical protein
MTMFEGFRPVAEVTADERACVAVSRARAPNNDRYAVCVSDEGCELTLKKIRRAPSRPALA